MSGPRLVFNSSHVAARLSDVSVSRKNNTRWVQILLKFCFNFLCFPRFLFTWKDLVINQTAFLKPNPYSHTEKIRLFLSHLHRNVLSRLFSFSSLLQSILLSAHCTYWSCCAVLRIRRQSEPFFLLFLSVIFLKYFSNHG